MTMALSNGTVLALILFKLDTAITKLLFTTLSQWLAKLVADSKMNSVICHYYKFVSFCIFECVADKHSQSLVCTKNVINGGWT